MAASQKGSSDALLTEINVTPLVDVVLVLLILMMVTATALASKSIPVELPKAKTGEADGNAKPFVLTVDEQGAMWLEREAADATLIRSRARDAVARDANVSAVLAADGRARHEAVVRALEILRSERVGKIAIVVRAEPSR